MATIARGDGTKRQRACSRRQVLAAMDWNFLAEKNSAKNGRSGQVQRKHRFSRRFFFQPSLAADTFPRMERVLAEARAAGLDVGEMKRRVDGKGVVIFTLESGGSIRDTGKDLYFSWDTATEALAISYARAKWGKSISLEGNRISQSLPERKLELLPEKEHEVTREPRWSMER